MAFKIPDSLAGSGGLSVDGDVQIDAFDNTSRWIGVYVRKNSTGTVVRQPRLNLIEGSNVTITVSEDTVDGEVDITIASTGGGGGGGSLTAGDGIDIDGSDIISVVVGDLVGTGIEDDGSNNFRISAAAAGAGLTGGAGAALAVGAGTGITVNADDVQLSTIADDTFMANVSGSAAVATGKSFSSLAGLNLSYDATNHELDWDGVDIRKNSTGSTFTRPRINFIEGANVTLTVTDDSGDGEVDVTITSSPGGSTTVPAKFDTTHTPIALYHFDGDANDYSGNGFNLTSGTATFTQVDPTTGRKALYLGNTISRPSNDAALTITGDVTIQVIAKMVGTPSGITTAFLSFTASGETLATNTMYQLGFSGVSDLRWIHESGAGAADSILLATDAALMPFSPFTIGYFAAVRASNVVTIYFNGLPYGSPSGTFTAASGGTSAVLTINPSTATTFICLGAKIVNSALSAADIKAEYNRTMGVAFGTIP